MVHQTDCMNLHKLLDISTNKMGTYKSKNTPDKTDEYGNGRPEYIDSHIKQLKGPGARYSIKRLFEIWHKKGKTYR